MPPRDRPLFVVGDVHLHRDCDPRTADDFAQFVEAIRSSTSAPAIVCNGDLFDLDRVAGEPARGMSPNGAAQRLVRIFDLFPGVAAALQAHLAVGGSLWLIAGNHDAELVLASVQRELRSLLGASERNLHVRDQLAWPDLIIEHGHQSDPDACFFPDTATAVRKRRLSALPLACLITRLLLSDIPRFALMGDNHRTPLQVLLRVLLDYRLAAFEMIARYPVAGVRIVMRSVRARRRGDVPASIHASTMASPLEVARRLYLDRYFAAVCALALAVAAAWQWVPAWVWWPLSVLVLGLAVPPARRADFAGRDALASTRVAHAHAQAGARLIVHGHTHRAFVQRIAHGALYANHGAFSQAHAAPAARGVWARPYLAIAADTATCRLMMHPCGDARKRGDP